jgi:hypothetical protein
MSVHVTFNRNCDRCEKPFDQRILKYEEGLPPIEAKALVLTDGGKQVFSYADLCPTCEGVVGKLVRRLKMDEEKEKKDEKKMTTDAGPKSEGATEKTNKELTEPVAASPSGTDDCPF